MEINANTPIRRRVTEFMLFPEEPLYEAKVRHSNTHAHAHTQIHRDAESATYFSDARNRLERSAENEMPAVNK